LEKRSIEERKAHETKTLEIRRTLNLKYQAEKDGRAADAKKYQEEADRLARERAKKDAEAKAIEDAEDEAERQRALNDKKRYESLEQRSLIAKQTAIENQRTLTILHEKEMKA